MSRCRVCGEVPRTSKDTRILNPVIAPDVVVEFNSLNSDIGGVGSETHQKVCKPCFDHLRQLGKIHKKYQLLRSSLLHKLSICINGGGTFTSHEQRPQTPVRGPDFVSRINETQPQVLSPNTIYVLPDCVSIFVYIHIFLK